MKRRSRGIGWRKKQRGSAMIEFAVTAITLLLVIFGGIEMDRMILVYSNLADAAVEGVRYASVQTSFDATSIQNMVQNYTTGINTANLSVVATTTAGDHGEATGKPGSKVKVVAQYTYDPWVSHILPSGLKLTAISEGVVVY